MAYLPDRGDAIWISLQPQAVVLSPSTYNGRAGLAVICPITSQVKGYPFEVLIPEGLNVRGAVLSDQVKSLDWRARQAELIGRLPSEIIEEILAKLLTLLSSGRASDDR